MGLIFRGNNVGGRACQISREKTQPGVHLELRLTRCVFLERHQGPCLLSPSPLRLSSRLGCLQG